MSNGIEWAPAPKFPGYEVSKNHLIRNSKTKRIVPQRFEPFARERKAKVTLIHRNDRPIEVFVDEVVRSAFGGK
jgi:hypothetical protein